MNEIEGWPTVLDWFGYSPNFHDAEVLSINLRRDPEPSTLSVHVWRTNKDLTPEGHYRKDRHAIATFKIRRISSLKLDKWNHQNVLSELWIDRASQGFEIHMPSIYGVEASIIAADISVSIEAFVA